MTFVPYPGKIEFRPIDDKGPIESLDKNYLEMGEVLQVGDGVSFVKPGDTIFFASHGVFETPEVDGVKHYLVHESSEYILGRIDGTD